MWTGLRVWRSRLITSTVGNGRIRISCGRCVRVRRGLRGLGRSRVPRINWMIRPAMLLVVFLGSRSMDMGMAGGTSTINMATSTRRNLERWTGLILMIVRITSTRRMALNGGKEEGQDRALPGQIQRVDKFRLVGRSDIHHFPEIRQLPTSACSCRISILRRPNDGRRCKTLSSGLSGFVDDHHLRRRRQLRCCLRIIRLLIDLLRETRC